MKKLTKRILSVFLIALLVCTLLPMGAFAEEVAEPQTEEVAEQKVVAVDAAAERALVSGETQTCRFKILYVDSSFNIGYNYGDDWNVDYTCQYTTGHSGYNHSMACSVIKEQVDAASGKVNDGWEIVGWSKEANANPRVLNTYTSTTATQTTYTIYIVAKKTTPAPVSETYTVKYVDTDGSEAAETQTATNTAGSATFTVTDVNETTAANHAGQNFIGWKDEATGVTYQPGGTITVSNPTTVNLTAMWEAKAVEKTFKVEYYEEKGGSLFSSETLTSSNGVSANFTVSSNFPNRGSEYTFEGWVDKLDQKYEINDIKTISSSDSNVDVDGNTVTLNLYATWTGSTTPPTPDEKTFTVNYIDNDENGTKAADSQTAKSTETADFTTRTLAEVYESIIAAHPDQELVGWKDPAGQEYSLGGGFTMVAPSYELTLIAVWKDKGGTGGGETPDEPGDEKVSVPGMIKTVNGKTGEGAIGTLKPGDTVGFTLKTNVGEDMMWKKNDDGTKEQVLTENKEGRWEGTYVLTITDTMEGPMTADWTTLKVTLKGADITGAEYVTKTTNETGFVITIDCVAALNAGKITVDDIGLAEVLVTYTATVNADAADGAVLKNTASVNGSADSVVTGDVTNPPIEPPHTGGNGTRMFTIGGVLILAAACVLFAVSRKKAKD